MQDFITANWAILTTIIAGLLLVLTLFLLTRRKTKVEIEELPVEQASAKRNNALIDAEPSAKQAEPVPTPSPAPQAAAGVDDLTQIKGLGPKLAAQLQGLGVTSLTQIAAWDDTEIDRIDAQLGRFAGRIRRDNWVEQARLLISGDKAAYEGQFGRS